jgi:16S rRNA (guanine527-N7)-methyltransferase
LDVGTGGGLPGIPLAILQPCSQFTLVDSIHKKTEALVHMVQTLELKNVRVCNARLEQWRHPPFQAVVGRAVLPFHRFVTLVSPFLAAKENRGIFYWTGGELAELIPDRLKRHTQCFDLSVFFDRTYCPGKKILHFFDPVDVRGR